MVVFSRFDWRSDRIAHIITKHGVTPGEVEEACFGNPLILRGRGRGERKLYYVLGQTGADRYLFVVLKPSGRGIVRSITAREMTTAERRRYLGR